MGHQWEEDSFPIKHKGKRVAWGRRRVLLCGVCGAEQLQLIDTYGKVGSRHYDYPDGYSEVTGMKRTEARALRIRQMRANGKK